MEKIKKTDMKTRPKCVFNATIFLYKHAKW